MNPHDPQQQYPPHGYQQQQPQYPLQGYQQQQPQYPPQGYQPQQQYPPMPQQAAPPSETPLLDPHARDNQGERFATQSKYRDAGFAIAFLVQLAIILVLGIFFYVKYNNLPSSSKRDSKHGEEEVTFKFEHAFVFIGLFLTSSILTAAMWLVIIRKFANCLVWFTLLLSVFAEAVTLIAFLATGQVAGALISGLMLLLNLAYIYFIRNRIKYTAVLLETVVGIFVDYPAPIFVSFCSVFAQALWVIVWVFTAAFAIEYTRRQGRHIGPDGEYVYEDNESGLQGVLGFVLLLSFFWTSQVIKNVVHVTVAGTVATWYFLAPPRRPENPTVQALKRATTTSFGSICLGSLIVAFVKALRAMVEGGKNSKNDLARQCAACLLKCLERIIEFFNKYAFTQVAIYGKTFCQAAKDTWTLIKRQGIDVIINEDLTSGVLVLAAIASGFIVAALSGALAHFSYKIEYWFIYAAIGFLCGFVISSVALTVIDSAVATVYVCFAEDPGALSQSNPSASTKLINAWRERFGDKVSLLHSV